MYRLFTCSENGEIPILGSSRAEAGFAPMEIANNAFNYGLSGSSARETAFHLKAVLSRPGHGLVIVNLDPWGLGNGSFLGDYRFVADNTLVKSEPKICIPLADRLPGIRFQGKTRGNLAQCMNNRLAVQGLDRPRQDRGGRGVHHTRRHPYSDRIRNDQGQTEERHIIRKDQVRPGSEGQGPEEGTRKQEGNRQRTCTRQEEVDLHDQAHP